MNVLNEELGEDINKYNVIFGTKQVLLELRFYL